MTKNGIKTEDYREITKYWISRLLCLERGDGFRDEIDVENFISYLEQNRADTKFVVFDSGYSIKPFLTNTTTLGYPKSSDLERILKLEHKGIEIRVGNPDWGAEPNKLYFVIKHGTSINQA